MTRDTLTTNPPAGDYILSPTGFTWNVLRRDGPGSSISLSTGDRKRETAVIRIRSMAERDRVDGWATAGTGMFWRITRFRP